MSALRSTRRRRSIGYSDEEDEDGGQGRTISKRSKPQEQTDASDLPDDFLEPLGPDVLISFPPELFPSTFNNRQFWKAGTFSETAASANDEDFATEGIDRVRVHPKFLHSNATSHKWVFGAIAELLDNAVDEINNGATMVNIDVLKNPKTEEPMLLIEDNGGGMNPECIRHCMSFGYSAKSTQANTIGQYGNGFKTSTMRLGADVLVFTRNTPKHGGAPTQSIGLLSYTFLTKTGQDDILVPIVDYEIEAFGLRKIIRGNVQQWEESMDTLKWWSPYSEEAELLDQFQGMSHQGTKVIMYNLWEDQEGHLELDFRASRHDIQVRGANRDEKCIELAERYPSCCSYYTYRYSLQTYMSILYLHLPSKFKMFLRGKQVAHHSMTDDLLCIEKVTYKPKTDQTARDCGQMKAVVTLGFVKDGKEHLDVRGFNVYHKNRLIKPFWRLWNTGDTRGRGIMGYLEANFVEPAHDKQGFEKTVVLTRLQNRLLEIMKVFWFKNCHKIGYVNKHASRDDSTPGEEPHLQNGNHSLGKTFLKQTTASAEDTTTEASLANMAKHNDQSRRKVSGNIEVIELADSDQEDVMPETEGKQQPSVPNLLVEENIFSEIKMETDVHESEASASTACKLIEAEAIPLMIPLSISCNSTALHLDEDFKSSIPSCMDKPGDSHALCSGGESVSEGRLLDPGSGVAHLAVDFPTVNSSALGCKAAKANTLAGPEGIVTSSLNPQEELLEHDTHCSGMREVLQRATFSPTDVATQEAIAEAVVDSSSECLGTEHMALTQRSETAIGSPTGRASGAMQHILSMVKSKSPRESLGLMHSHRLEDAIFSNSMTLQEVEMEQGRTIKEAVVKCATECRMQEDVIRPAESVCHQPADFDGSQHMLEDPSSCMQDVDNRPAEVGCLEKEPTCLDEREEDSSSCVQRLGFAKVSGFDMNEKNPLTCMPELGLVKVPSPSIDLACCPHTMEQKVEYLRRTIKAVLEESEQLQKQLQLQQECCDAEVHDLEKELDRVFSCIDKLNCNVSVAH